MIKDSVVHNVAYITDLQILIKIYNRKEYAKTAFRGRGVEEYKN